MKTLKSYIGVLMMGVIALFASCSPESYEGADPNGIPSLDGVEPVVTVDQDLNQVTFSLPADCKGVMPLWIFYENKGTDKEKVTYSTVNGFKKIFTKAGDYEYEFKLMNRNGVSDGSKTGTFHINNTIMSFDKYVTLLCGGLESSSKEWRIDNSKAGHLGCGPSGTTGTEWWSAGADEKAGTGLYDNRLVFGSDYSYDFNPGDNGTMYVNYGTTALNTTGATEDFSMKVDELKTTYEFDVDGDDLYLVLPEHTYFPYIANDDIWSNPRFKVESITGSEINLVSDNGAIAWHYILTSGADTTFKGFKYNSQYNLWKPIDDEDAYTTHFWYAPGWSQIADPGFAKNGSEYTFTLPEATTDQWQAQCPLKPNEGKLHLSASNLYDFSCTLNSSEDIKQVTVKLTDVNSGDNYVFVERVDLKAYEDKVFYVYGVNNLTADADCELFFDFGGNPANTTVSVKNIVVKDHANDDGTVVPSDDPEPTPAVDWREADNLLNNANMSDISYYYAHGSAWEQYANPEMTQDGNAYTLKLDGQSDQQWQCQFTFNNTGVALSADKTYDYRVVLNSTNPIAGVTVKLTQQDDDGVYITADRHDITTAYTDQTIELVGLTGADISNLKIVYDFGGNPANTEVTVKDMLLQEHKKSASEMTWDATSASNLWTADLVPNSFYYAHGGSWESYGYNPTITQNGRAYTIDLPGATDQQWQAQVTTETTLSTSASQTYDFQIILTSNVDLTGVTVKLTKVGDDNVFFTADRHDLKAYEATPIRYTNMAGLDIDNVKLVLDFGGNPADTQVEVSDIILRPAGSEAKRFARRRR